MLGFIPEPLPVMRPCRCIIGSDNESIEHAVAHLVISDEPGALVNEHFASTVGRCGNDAAALGAANAFDRTMIKTRCAHNAGCRGRKAPARGCRGAEALTRGCRGIGP